MSHALRKAWVLSLLTIGALCTGTALGQILDIAPLPGGAIPVPPQVAPLEEEKLDQYAVAFVAIEKIEQEAQTKLSAIKDAQAAQEIRAAAEDEILRAVERSGLELVEFNQIAELATRNEALRLKLDGKVDKRRGT